MSLAYKLPVPSASQIRGCFALGASGVWYGKEALNKQEPPGCNGITSFCFRGVLVGQELTCMTAMFPFLGRLCFYMLQHA